MPNAPSRSKLEKIIGDLLEELQKSEHYKQVEFHMAAQIQLTDFEINFSDSFVEIRPQGTSFGDYKL